MKPRLAILNCVVPLLTLFLAAPAYSADGSAEAPFRFYTVLDGLTQSNVVDIGQDQAGYLWFATARGLNRYDGHDFDQYTIADGLPNNSLTALHVSDTNSVWVGDVRGYITILHGARVAQSSEPLGGMGKSILDIEIIGERNFAVVDEVGIVEITSGENQLAVKWLIGDKATGITDIAVHGDDVLVESSTGLYRFDFSEEPKLEMISTAIRITHADANDTLWVSDTVGRIGIWRDGAFDELFRIDSPNAIVSIDTSSDGLVWVATRNELFSFDGRSQPTQPVGDHLKEYTGVEDVTSIFIDRENSLWMTSGSRLIRFLGDRFRHYRLQTEFDSETVWATAEDLQGRFWFGTESKLLMRASDESLLVVGPEHGVPEGTVRDVVPDGEGGLWIGITDHGLYYVDVNTMKAAHVAESTNVDVLDIALAVDGAVWFSTIGSGVFRYLPDTKSMSKFKVPDATSVYTLDVGADGSVWYGADEVGLVKLTPNKRGGYEQRIIGSGEVDGLPVYQYARLASGNDGGYVEVPLDPADGLPKRLFNHINLTGLDSAWIATEEGGLYRLEDNQFTDYGAVTPLSDQTVYLVEHLDDGTIVVGGEQGLYQLIPGVPGVVHYNQQAGFTGLETNVHSSLVDSDGHLWVGTVDGATRMDTSQSMPRRFELTPQIVRVESQLSGHEILDQGKIEPKELGARVEFAAISLRTPRGVQYSYKLDGVDAEWGSPTTSRSVSYPRIPPGSYVFVVRARYPGGDWSERVATHHFTVMPFFWQQPWFVLAIIIMGILVLHAIMTNRTRKIEWLNTTLRAQVEERTQSIELARRNLADSNERLSAEIGARADLETRFRRAFENAPIGMGLLDVDGNMFDANPALITMFWPGEELPAAMKFVELVNEEHRDQFEERYRSLIVSMGGSFDKRLDCTGPDGAELHTVVNLSSVHSDGGEFLYSVVQIQDITESMQLTMQLEYQASYDELTGLLNRRAFEAQLERSWLNRADSRKMSFLMFMDLDQFKVVNDTSGHTAGDELLRAVSDTLTQSVRDNDIVGRLGGDEFGIILWECPTEVAVRIAESIRESIENFRFHWGTETYRIGVSIGGIPIDPEVGDISELQQLADAACYAAKEAGRNRVHMVSGEADSARVHRGQVRWVQRLREAMDNNRFAIYAQPIKPADNSIEEPESMEVLLRLRDRSTRKLIPPGAFLPAAERYGMSVELDKWVITSLFNMLFVHHAFEACDRKYWINLSGSSVGDRRFAEFLKDAVMKSPLPRGTINFEITETAVIRSISEASELMTALREMGCQFALDDFGSGLSSFSYLKKLPVDYVKIDGCFIRDLMHDDTDRIFVKSIIDIAHALGIKTVAEFVESDEILQTVRELGADYVQGFAIGKPFAFAPEFPANADADNTPSDVQKLAG